MTGGGGREKEIQYFSLQALRSNATAGTLEMTARSGAETRFDRTPDSRLPTPDSRLPTPDSRLPTPDS